MAISDMAMFISDMAEPGYATSRSDRRVLLGVTSGFRHGSSIALETAYTCAQAQGFFVGLT